MTTVFVCHHHLAGYGSAIFLPINDVFLELVLTGQLIKQLQPVVTPIQDAGQSSRTAFWTLFCCCMSSQHSEDRNGLYSPQVSPCLYTLPPLEGESSWGQGTVLLHSPSTLGSAFHTGFQDVRRVTNHHCVNDDERSPPHYGSASTPPEFRLNHSRSSGWI